ncbi:transposase [Streptomyces sp. ME19-01-6]|uniref:transposase n=1 Tax=Streptomyces sp. ME19-01-6 TaxID=3028686 RepID=UPI0029C9E752|nr:transposase [Streptomyces sp. ME19-01-6]
MLLGNADRLKAMADEWTGAVTGQPDGFEERRAELDRQIRVQRQALATALGVAAKQVAARALCLAESEKAVERLIAPLHAELDAMLETQREMTARQAESERAQERSAQLLELASMARRTLNHLPLERQKEFMTAIEVKVTFLAPPRRARNGQPCALAGWFTERQLPIPLLTDEGWAKIEPMITHKARGVSPRQVMTGILYKVRTGTPWSDLPALFGRTATLRTYSARWRESGFWENAMLALADAESTPLSASSELNTRIECSIDPQKLQKLLDNGQSPSLEKSALRD